MLSDREIAWLGALKLKSGASRALIHQVLQKIGGTLPADYVELIERANGGEGFVGGRGSYLEFWPIEEIPEVYLANDIERSAPGLLPFASDGGGNVYAFDREISPIRIVEVPLIGISRRYAKSRANSVGELLAIMAAPGLTGP
ncbi:MAG TPA: SMI1/KNR4 family protein [Tepidisphaeraceae bacterium]|jgi:hypothetical protein